MRAKGITLVELLVAMAILGVVLALASQLIVQNQSIGNRQVQAGRMHEDLRLATLRMADVIAQAAYIYPNDASLRVKVGTSTITVDTGSQALAALLPGGSAYCSVPSSSYCGFLYRVEARAGYTEVLGNLPGNSGFVLVEYQAPGLSWSADSVPSRDWSGVTAVRGVVADSVLPTETVLGDLAFSGTSDGIDHRVLITPANNPEATTSHPNALIGSVQVRITLSFQNGLRAVRRTEVLARGVPRAIPPGL
jgi:prepilin-type N-terminal cleavage/methylation domain-containing protein